MSINRVMPVMQYNRTPRRSRRPDHHWALRTRPWQIQPFLVAPVLPAETLKSALLQARVVTDPLKNALIGWWTEYYFFYVKLSDLNDREDFTAMHLQHDYDLSGQRATVTTTRYYQFDGGIAWNVKLLRRVVECYFRDENEGWDAYQVGSTPAAQAQAHQTSWLDSAHNAADHIDQDSPMVDVIAGSPDQVAASEIEQAMQMWQFLKANNVVDITFEDYLKSFGIRGQAVEPEHKPELLRYVRDWTYPTNTVDPSTGTPSSACSWVIQDSINKDRFFTEPGFIFGVTVTRPKVYRSSQVGSVVGVMDDAFSWLPAVMRDDVRTSMKHIANGEGPLPNNSDADGYWLDVRDIFQYGDQFVNFALTETDAGLVALPTNGMQKRFADGDMADALFASAAPANQIRQDGILRLNILSSVQDTSPSFGVASA